MLNRLAMNWNEMKYEDDFLVSIPSAFYLQYQEGEKVMNVDMDFRDQIPVLYYQHIRSWNSPHQNEVIPEGQKKLIFENIQYYLKEIKKFDFEIE